jgi:hypothetical protein
MILKCHCLQIIPFVQLYAGLFSNHSPLYFTNTKRFFSKMGLACHIAKIHSEVIELKGGMQVFFFFLVLGFILASYYVLKQLLLVVMSGSAPGLLVGARPVSGLIIYLYISLK